MSNQTNKTKNQFTYDQLTTPSILTFYNEMKIPIFICESDNPILEIEKQKKHFRFHDLDLKPMKAGNSRTNKVVELILRYSPFNNFELPENEVLENYNKKVKLNDLRRVRKECLKNPKSKFIRYGGIIYLINENKK